MLASVTSPYQIRVICDKWKECIQIRQKEETGDELILFQQTQRLGTAIADFLEEDPSSLGEYVKMLSSAIEKGDTSILNRQYFIRIADAWIKKSSIYAPLYIELMNLLSDVENDRIASTSGLELFVNDCILFRNSANLLTMVHGQSINDFIDTYSELRSRNPKQFPALQFGCIQYELSQNMSMGPCANTQITEAPVRLSEVKQELAECATFDALYCDNLKELLFFLEIKAQEVGILFPECKCCGRLFAARRNSRRMYCDKLAPNSTKRCDEIGWQKDYDRRRAESPVDRMYLRAYKRYYARCHNGTISKAEFDAWTEKARLMRDECLSGHYSLDEYDEWLSQEKQLPYEP